MTFLGSPFRGVVVALALAALSGAACFDSGDRPDKGPPPPPSPVEVDLTQAYQRIDGFGASSAWTANNVSDALADQFFSPELGIGLSLLRVQIKPAGNTAELGTARKAAARGAKVWAAPWSPPAEWKSNGSTINGGSLLDAHRADWANRLAAFASTMAAEGIPLAAISAQNEPNYQATWDTCIYTPAQLVTFVRDFLGPALAAQNLNVPVMAPETQGWDQFARFADPLIADSATVGMLGPIATHHYGGAPFDYGPAKTAGKVLWQTEVSDDKIVKTLDSTIDSGLRVAAMIHENLVQGNVSAWHYWWLMPGTGDGNGALTANAALLPRAYALGNWSKFVRPGFLRVAAMIHENLVQGNVSAWHYWWLMPGTGDGNGALTANMALLPRAYVMGNWSKFVRPGFLRVAATPLSQDYLYVSAFHEPAGGRVVVVAVNQKYSDLQQDFTIAGGTVTQLTPWLTAEGTPLLAQGAVSVVDGKFTAQLPARSVTTFVGTATP